MDHVLLENWCKPIITRWKTRSVKIMAIKALHNSLARTGGLCARALQCCRSREGPGGHASQYLGKSVNPISTRGSLLCSPNYYWFSDLPTVLHCISHFLPRYPRGVLFFSWNFVNNLCKVILVMLCSVMLSKSDTRLEKYQLADNQTTRLPIWVTDIKVEVLWEGHKNFAKSPP